MSSHDFYITAEQEDKLQDLFGEGEELLQKLRDIGAVHHVVVVSCYIRCNTRHDPPLGDMILNLDLDGSPEAVGAFSRELLHLIR